MSRLFRVLCNNLGDHPLTTTFTFFVEKLEALLSQPRTKFVQTPRRVFSQHHNWPVQPLHLCWPHTSLSLNPLLPSSFTREQNHEILKLLNLGQQLLGVGPPPLSDLPQLAANGRSLLTESHQYIFCRLLAVPRNFVPLKQNHSYNNYDNSTQYWPVVFWRAVTPLILCSDKSRLKRDGKKNQKCRTLKTFLIKYSHC